MIIELQKAFSHILYKDKNHTYFNTRTNSQLIPTTTYKKEFSNEFENKEYWLQKKAKEANVTVEQMQDLWEEKKIVGTKRGTIFHNNLEQLTWRKEVVWSSDMPGMTTLKYQAYNYVQDHSDDYNVATELVIGNEIIGGQIDRLFDRKNQLFIGDYKTDSKTEDELLASYGKKMKKHLSYLTDSILNQYFVQVNIYRQILKQSGFYIDGMEIYHFCINNDNYKVYDVPIIDVLQID